MIEKFKNLIRQNSSLYAPIQTWRSFQQEHEYICLNNYYQQLRDVSTKCENRFYNTPVKKMLNDIRIFVIIAHDWEHRTLTPVLKKDFDIEVFDYGDYAHHLREKDWFFWRDKLQKEIMTSFNTYNNQNPFDLVFAYGSYTHFARETLMKMRESGVPVALMWLDDKHTFLPNPKAKYPTGQKPLIGSVDVHLTNSLACVQWYQAEGANTLYMAEGCNPDVDFSVKPEKKYDVSFVGKLYGARNGFVNKLKSAGINIECFGPGWPNGPIADEYMTKLFTESWINLGFGGVRYSDKVTCLKGRDFDVPATGSAYLTTFDPELAKMFNIGTEILCYRSQFDAIEQIQYYLKHKDLLTEVGQNAYKRCVQDHSWTQRLITVLNFLGYMVEK